MTQTDNDDQGCEYIPTPEQLETAKRVEWERHLAKKRRQTSCGGRPSRMKQSVPRLDHRHGGVWGD